MATSSVEIRLELDWARDGDEWLQHLHGLIGIGSSASFGGDEPGLFDHAEYEAGDPRLTSWLWVRRGEDGRIVCTIVADEPPSEDEFLDQIGPWRDAVLTAAQRVGMLDPASWYALLGPCPRLASGFVFGADHRPVALTGAIDVGPVRLEPGGVLMHEMVDARPLLLGDHRYPFSSSPLILRGTAASYGEYPDLAWAFWPMNRLGALQQSRRAAALVSLAWNEYWILRTEPVRIVPDQPIVVTHLADGYDAGKTRWPGGCDAPPQHQPAEFQQRELPGWLDAAWANLDRDRRLRYAVDAYYEALRALAEHPTLAALLLVTVIEGVGARIARGAGDGGAKDDFRVGLDVLPPEQATALANTAYGLRSQTAHRGMLHGAESTFGYVRDSDFRIDAAERFEEDHLDAIHRAARASLLHAVATPDPSPGA